MTSLQPKTDATLAMKQEQSGGFCIACHIGSGAPVQLTEKPKESKGCAAICCAVHKKSGSSMLNCLFRKGARPASVIKARDNWALRDGSRKNESDLTPTRHCKRWIGSLSLRAPCDFSSHLKIAGDAGRLKLRFPSTT